MVRTIYAREDCGCYGDGTNGVAHVNTRAVYLAEQEGFIPTENNGEVIEDLDDDDADAWDELAMDAIAYLNANCVEAGISFQFVDGDLLLIADEECGA